MVLDTSAIVAAIAGEPDGPQFQEAILRAPVLMISAVTALESRIVLLRRYGEDAVREFERMIDDAAVSIVPFDGEMAARAFEAYRQYGKGRGHPAQLNISIVPHTHWPAARVSHCFSKGPIFRGPAFGPACSALSVHPASL